MSRKTTAETEEQKAARLKRWMQAGATFKAKHPELVEAAKNGSLRQETSEVTALIPSTKVTDIVQHKVTDIVQVQLGKKPPKKLS